MNDIHDRTVLLVDDEPFVLESLERVLSREPYEVLVAASGAEALEIIHQYRIDVIVSDEMMPGMTGSQLFSEVSRTHPETVRITLTGQATMDAAIRLINEGSIFRFLTKPCNAVDLAQTIRQALQMKELARQTSRLLAVVDRQREALDRLEGEYPGISALERRPDGAIVLEEVQTADIEALTSQIRSRLGGAPA